MTDGFEYLEVEDLVALAIDLFGEPVPFRDAGLVASAAARPPATIWGVDASSDQGTKSAALLQSLLGTHAPIDGNKRLGWLAAAVFLELNGVTTTDATNEDVYDFVMWATASGADIEEIAARLESLIES